MYARRHLIEAYLGAQARGFGGYLPESSAFNAALKAYHAGMLDGLGQLFGLHLDSQQMDTFNNRVYFRLFVSTADSLLALRTPWSGFLEAGLLVRKVEQAGPDGQRVMTASSRIGAVVEESRQQHLEMLDALAAIMLGDRAALTFSRADLRAIGVDDTAPNPADYPIYDD
ncbi:hypothetical protein ABT369_47605 [Dactylosporangium sp. NPDC000244]|uniref:hypothetical protein n=1 Tax=Dactylosporangium sp. NPDC000244 TaxID=3154365 RepID=UPI00332818B7